MDPSPPKVEATMPVTPPDWLTRHGGNLLPSRDGRSYTVYFGHEPQYVLALVPAGGKFACRVTQTINGRRLDLPGTHPAPDDAVAAGLEALRQALGW